LRALRDLLGHAGQQLHEAVGVGVRARVGHPCTFRTDDRVGPGRVDAGVARRRHAGIGLAQVDDTIAELGVQRVARAVGRAVVDDDDFLDRPGLREHAAHGVQQQVATVPSRYDDRNLRTLGHAVGPRQERPLW